MVYTLDASELIMEVMDGAPATWNTVLTTQLYRNVVEFQSAIRFHEDSLLRLSEVRNPRWFERDSHERDFRNVRTNLVGSKKLGQKIPPPKYPKDDSNVSKRATPASKGARPCRHCGSSMHWDPECKYAHKAAREARANLVQLDDDENVAQEEYDDLYYALSSDDESNGNSQESKQDFCSSLQSTEPLIHLVNSDKDNMAETPALGGLTDPQSGSLSTSEDLTLISANITLDNSECEGRSVHAKFIETSTADESTFSSSYPKPPLNRRSRRRLAREVEAVNFAIRHEDGAQTDKPLIELKRYMARPPGCSFLGAKATQTWATVGSINGDRIGVLKDTGSDITLISQQALEGLKIQPKCKAGQSVSLIQVTGKSSVKEYIPLDLYFHTEEGPVKITVEAYVVKGMSIPFILGNDFADQYSLSVIRDQGDSYIVFGDSGRRLHVNSSTSALVDEHGNSFKVLVEREFKKSETGMKASIHRKHQKLKQRYQARTRNGEVHAMSRTVIPPETSVAIPVKVHFPKDVDTLFIKK